MFFSEEKDVEKHLCELMGEIRQITLVAWKLHQRLSATNSWYRYQNSKLHSRFYNLSVKNELFNFITSCMLWYNGFDPFSKYKRDTQTLNS